SPGVLLRGGGMGPCPPRSGSIALAVTSLLAGDFDGDGKTDLTIFDSERKQLAALFNRGGGSFKSTTPFFVNGQSFYSTNQGLASSDLDGDGKDDLVILNAPQSTAPYDGMATVLLSTGVG